MKTLLRAVFRAAERGKLTVEGLWGPSPSPPRLRAVGRAQRLPPWPSVVTRGVLSKSGGRDCYASCMAWVVTDAGTLKGTRPQPKLATHCTKPIQEAVGNGFPKGAPRIRLRRYSSCSHENLFLGKKIQKKLTAAERSKVHAPSRCWGPMAPAEASRRSLAGGLWVPHRYGY